VLLEWDTDAHDVLVVRNLPVPMHLAMRKEPRELTEHNHSGGDKGLCDNGAEAQFPVEYRSHLYWHDDTHFVIFPEQADSIRLVSVTCLG
jgi:hypothetical protein